MRIKRQVMSFESAMWIEEARELIEASLLIQRAFFEERLEVNVAGLLNLVEPPISGLLTFECIHVGLMEAGRMIGMQRECREVLVGRLEDLDRACAAYAARGMKVPAEWRSEAEHLREVLDRSLA